MKMHRQHLTERDQVKEVKNVLKVDKEGGRHKIL